MSDDRYGIAHRFESLSLAIPDPSQFDYIKHFLHTLLNVQKPELLVEDGSVDRLQQGHEILPEIFVPPDLWLKDNITIKDVKIKVTMMTEINSMIEREVSGDNHDLLDETALLYYQKLLMAYKFYEPSSGPGTGSGPRPGSGPGIGGRSLSHGTDFSLREELDEEEDYETKLLNRTVSNQLSNSLRTHQSYFSNNGSSNSTHSNNYNYNTLNNNGNNSRRGSSQSKEHLLSRKRFLSLISNGNGHNGTGNNGHNSYNGHNGHNSNHNSYNGQFNGPQGINGSPTNVYTNGFGSSIPPEKQDHEDDHKKQQALNSILSKSRIYNKIKKNRELNSSMNSNISIPSLPQSARNSISTTTTTGSSTNPKSKRASSITTPEPTDLRHASFVPVPSFASYSLSQRQEIQRNKYDYYVQVFHMLNLIDRILRLLQLNPHDTKSFKLMDFIKRYVFKFIVLDASDMVIKYAEIGAYRLYSRLN